MCICQSQFSILDFLVYPPFNLFYSFPLVFGFCCLFLTSLCLSHILPPLHIIQFPNLSFPFSLEPQIQLFPFFPIIIQSSYSLMEMDWRKKDDRRKTGSVRAAIDMFGSSSSSPQKPQLDSPQKSSSIAKELHMAKRDISRYKDNKRAADTAKAKAEFELVSSRKTVKELSTQIEESNSKAKAKMRDIEAMKKAGSREDEVLGLMSVENSQYEEVTRELEFVKNELSKLKLKMASVSQEKAQAEKKVEESRLKLSSNTESVGALRKEIDVVNEEQVLVELAQIEAMKEFGEIEAQREKEASEFSFTMEDNKKKLKDAAEKLEESKELEHKLAATLSDVTVLQSELNLVKEMDKRVRRIEDSEGSPTLVSIRKELEVAKKELALLRAESFQFMASMDIIRNELTHVTEEISRMKKAEEKTDMKVQSLNSKLLRAKSKLEAATASEEKAKSIVNNLSVTLEQLKREAEASKKQNALVVEETTRIKAEIKKTESEIDLAEEKLEAAMQELEEVKSSEALALQNLKSLIENTKRGRASDSQKNSRIVLSKFEYEYLTGRANGAEEIAEKKIAAAQAWVEALKASEREILMKSEIAEREIREMRIQEQKLSRTDSSPSAKRMVERELFNSRQENEKMVEAEKGRLPFPRKPFKGSENSTPSRRGKCPKSASPAWRKGRSTPIFIKKKRKVMPSLVKFFGAKRIEKDN